MDLAFKRFEAMVMKVPQFTMRRMMVGIAAFAVALSVLLRAPFVILLIGPLVGSLWAIRKGRKEVIGGSVGGAISWGCFGLVELIYAATHGKIYISKIKQLYF